MGSLARWSNASVVDTGCRRFRAQTSTSSAAISSARFASRIRDAVAVRLESEVPLGVFLSGGLDSSVVVAEMSELGIRPKTYSVGFEQEAFDERSFAELVARRFATDHHTLVPEMDVASLFQRFTGAYDEPFADSSALATLAVAEAASQHVTVVLTGDGGDELFGGYDRYRVHRLAELTGSIPGVVRRPAAVVGGACRSHGGLAPHRVGGCSSSLPIPGTPTGTACSISSRMT